MMNLMLHSLQPSRGAVNFILAQLYIGVNMIGKRKQLSPFWRGNAGRHLHSIPLFPKNQLQTRGVSH